VNECEESSPCGAESECVNTEGSYECRCHVGYRMDPAHGCVDVNECIGGDACAANARYVNECERNPCGENAECIDTVGSFACSCKTDYTGDPFKECSG
ncbi:Latent-transforming growth factor beta-binding protein 4, partial [Trachymyrmex zeteki]